MDELHIFHQIKNHLDPKLEFEIEYSETKLNLFGFENSSSRESIEINIHYKETNTHLYLPFNSCHPRLTKTNIYTQ